MKDVLSELLATFVFVSVAMLAGGDAVLTAVGLAGALVFGRRIGPGHLNPAISTAMYVRQRISTSQYVSYVAAQVIGALAAITWASLASAAR